MMFMQRVLILMQGLFKNLDLMLNTVKNYGLGWDV
jgi:hypothetical protein